MNIRILYGLPPDKCVGRRRPSVHEIYGQYYTHLAQSARQPRRQGSSSSVSLYDFAHLVGLINKPENSTEECYYGEKSIKKQKTLLARLPATEYLRGRPCTHESKAIIEIHLLPPRDTE